jgi:hypothetical protein
MYCLERHKRPCNQVDWVQQTSRAKELQNFPNIHCPAPLQPLTVLTHLSAQCGIIICLDRGNEVLVLVAEVLLFA